MLHNNPKNIGEKVDLLQQQDKNFFGKKFRKQLIRSVKLKKETVKIFCDKGKKKQKPFWYGLSETLRRKSGGLQKFYLKRNSSGTARQKQSFITNKEVATDKVQTNKNETLFNMSFAYINLMSKLKTYIQ